MRVSRFALLSFCASASGSATAFVPSSSFGVRSGILASSSNDDDNNNNNNNEGGLLPQGPIGNFGNNQGPVKTLSSKSSEKRRELKPRALNVDNPLVGIRRSPIQPDPAPPPGPKVLSSDINAGPSLFEVMNQSSLLNRRKLKVDSTVTESSSESMEESDSAVDEGIVDETGSMEVIDQVESESEGKAESTASIIPDSTEKEESKPESSSAPVAPQSSIPDSAPTVKTGIKVKTGTALLNSSDGASNKPTRKTPSVVGSAENSGLSSIAKQASPVKTSQAASNTANTNAPTLFEQMDQRLVPRRPKTATTSSVKGPNDGKNGSPSEMPVLTSGMSGVADIRKPPDTRALSTGMDTPSLFDQIDNGIASSKRKSISSKPLSTAPPEQQQQNKKPIANSGMSSIADRRVPPRATEPAGTTIPSLFDQMDQSSRKTYVDPTEPIGWGGKRAQTRAPLEVIPPTLPETSEQVKENEPVTSDVVKGAESEPVAKAVVVEESKVETSESVKEVQTEATSTENEIPVVEKPSESSKAVSDASTATKTAPPAKKSRPVRTMTPLEKQFAEKEARRREKPKTKDPVASSDSLDEPISPKLPILGAKYMARLEKAAKNNPKVLREELEKRRVIEDDDDEPRAETEEHESPIKKALDQFRKGKKKQ